MKLFLFQLLLLVLCLFPAGVSPTATTPSSEWVPVPWSIAVYPKNDEWLEITVNIGKDDNRCVDAIWIDAVFSTREAKQLTLSHAFIFPQKGLRGPSKLCRGDHTLYYRLSSPATSVRGDNIRCRVIVTPPRPYNSNKNAGKSNQ
jgi:hypothetical protein